jgi:RHS repeat-associated protein
LIPAVDAPNGGTDIALSYNLVDQVTNITQGTTSTSFTYDPLGRRVNEVAGGLTTVRHYTDSSDNPEWTSQLDGSNSITEIYTGSLGSGMGVTTTVKNGVSSAAMQITDLQGHTVTTVTLAGNNTDYSSWANYDSFGNPLNPQTNTNLINYSAYGQQERATNTTGLILMGARVYNPETNQFTSIDPIPGGNENQYTYPNDPINNYDVSGLFTFSGEDLALLGLEYSTLTFVLTLVICDSAPLVCLQAGIVLGMATDMALQIVDNLVGPKSRTGNHSIDYESIGRAGLGAAISFRLSIALKPLTSKLFGFFALALDWLIDIISQKLAEAALWSIDTATKLHRSFNQTIAPDNNKVRHVKRNGKTRR